MQTRAASAQQQLLLNHAANNVELLRVYAATSQQQLLSKAHETFSQQHLLEQAHRPERLAGIDGGDAGRKERENEHEAITSIERE